MGHRALRGHPPYHLIRRLGITTLQLLFLDMAYWLSNKGTAWCNKGMWSVGWDLGMVDKNVYRMRRELVERGLLEVNPTNPKMYRPTRAYIDVMDDDVEHERIKRAYKKGNYES